LLSYDRAFTPKFTAGVRVGYALSGGPPAISGYDAGGNPTGKINFLPFHAEARLTYWILPLSKKGFRPYIHAGGGMAQVDAKVKVTVYDCSGVDCTTADPSTLKKVPIDAWKKLGQGFITVGGGTVFAINPQFGIQANFNFLYMLGSSGPVLQPSLGVVYGL
jgi:hypothetical protein